MATLVTNAKVYSNKLYTSSFGGGTAVDIAAGDLDGWYIYRNAYTGVLDVRSTDPGLAAPTWQPVVGPWDGSTWYAYTYNVYEFRYNGTQDETASYKLEYSLNAAPTVSSAPTVAYGTGNLAVGPNNSATVTFTAQDADAGDQGTDALDFEIRTAASGGGTLIDSGTCSHNVSKEITLTNAEITSLGQGNTTLYLSILDDDLDRSSDSSFTIRRDSVSPTASDSISTTPTIVTDTEQYTVTFTPHDATTTGANELDYEIRTASGGGGTLLTSGTATDNSSKTTATISDTLSDGNNTRYIRVTDGALNVTDTSFTVHRPYVESLTQGVAIGLDLTTLVTLVEEILTQGVAIGLSSTDFIIFFENLTQSIAIGHQITDLGASLLESPTQSIAVGQSVTDVGVQLLDSMEQGIAVGQSVSDILSSGLESLTQGVRIGLSVTDALVVSEILTQGIRIGVSVTDQYVFVPIGNITATGLAELESVVFIGREEVEGIRASGLVELNTLTPVGREHEPSITMTGLVLILPVTSSSL